MEAYAGLSHVGVERACAGQSKPTPHKQLLAYPAQLLVCPAQLPTCLHSSGGAGGWADRHLASKSRSRRSMDSTSVSGAPCPRMRALQERERGRGRRCVGKRAQFAVGRIRHLGGNGLIGVLAAAMPLKLAERKAVTQALR